MEKVIPLVTTPLALAALAILVLGVILQRTGARRDVVTKVFWLIMVLAIMGNVGFLLTRFVASDTIIRGSIRDTSGTPVSQVIVDIDDVGRTASRDDGIFEISAPLSRQRDKYNLIARGFGYELARLDLLGPRPNFTQVVLKPEILKADDAIDLHDELGVTQNLGAPAVSINFRIKKQFTQDVRLSFFQLRLKAPSGEILNLNPTFVQINGQPTPNYLIGMNLREPLVNGEATLLFEKTQFAKNATIAEITKKFGQYWWNTCAGQNGLDDASVEILSNYFDSAFSWLPGNYQATIVYRINADAGELKLDFALNTNEVSRLKNIRSKLKRCAGFALDMTQIPNLSYVDADSANFIFKTSNIDNRPTSNN